MEFPEHAEAKKKIDRHDGLPYVVGTIDWVFKLVITPYLPISVFLRPGANHDAKKKIDRARK